MQRIPQSNDNVAAPEKKETVLVTGGSGYVARFMAPMLGQRTQFDVSKAAKLLGWRPRPASEAVLECASDLIRQQLV